VIYESGHPFSQDSLGRFAAGTATREERRGIVRHLLADCMECRRGVLRALRGGGPASAEEYQRAISYAFERAVAALGAANQAPPMSALLAELDRQPPLRRQTLVRNHPRYRSIEVLDALAKRSFSLRFSDYDSMMGDANLAVCLAEDLDADSARRGTAEESAAKIRAWCYYANALRIVGKHDEAAQAFQKTIAKLEQSECGAELEAEVLEHMASLPTNERRFVEANDLLERAASIYRHAKSRNELGRVLLKQALNLMYAYQPTQAMEALLEASPLIDARSEPSLAISVLLTAVRCHLDENQPDQALNVFLLGRDLFQVQSEPLVVVKIWWTEGVLLLAHGHLEAARNLFERVHQEFVARKLHYYCALVSLDLALVLTQMGRFAEVRSLISQTLPVFQSVRVQRELLASIIMLTQVDRQESYVAIIREASRRLEREPGAVDLQALA
jgi:tetratricopeptide (TPR) repeat protein